MSKLASSRVMSSGLFALLAAGALGSVVGCSKPEEKKAAWSCTRDEVPMGETVRCTSAAITADGPVGGAVGGTTDGTTQDGTATNGTTSDGTTTNGGTTSDGTTSDGTTTNGSTSDGTTNGGTTSGGTTSGGTTSDGTTADGTNPGGTTDNTGGDGDGSVTYECPPGNDNPECPPDLTGDGSGDGTGGGTSDGTSDGTTTSGGTTSGGTTSGGTTSGGTSDGTSDGTNTSGGTTSGGTTSGGTTSGGTTSGGTSGSSGGKDGNTTDGTGPGSSSSGGTSSGGGGGGGGSSHKPGPDECSYVPDLPYCGGTGGGSTDGSSGGTTDGTGTSSSGGTSGTTSSGGTSGGTDCGKPNCTPPGQDKPSGGGTTDGTGASSSGGGKDGASSSGGAGGGNKGRSFTCKKDKKGNKSCVSKPDCATGTHPSACGACVSDDEGADDCVPTTLGGCWVTGGGFIEGASLVPAAAADGKDNFGGNAKPMKKGYVSGHWNHVDHGTGNHGKGRPEYIMCRVTDGPGPKQPGGKKGMVVNQVYFGGHAQWRNAATATWADGYWFDVVAEDHGEPGNTSALKNGQMPDSYHYTIRKIDDPTANASGVIVYETRGDLSGGNIQIHPNNNGHPAVNSPLPAWVTIEQ